MSRPSVDHAHTLLDRAGADLAAVRALEANRDVADEIVGFHAQQAAEKLLKAVLASHGFDYARTHSIRYLLELLATHGLSPPADLHRVVELYPFAVQFRYEAPLDDADLDRVETRELLERLREWAERTMPVA